MPATNHIRLIEYMCPRCSARRTVQARHRAPTRVSCPRCAELAGTTAVAFAGMVREAEIGVQEQMFSA